MLEVPARLQAPEALAVQGRPVFEAAEHIADVDVVERVVGKCPGLGGVLELELTVRRDPGRLGWREIDTCHRRTGKFVGEVAACVLVPCVDDNKKSNVFIRTEYR